MLKRIIFVFPICLVIFVGLFSIERQHSASGGRFLTLNIATESYYGSEYSKMVMINPNGQVERVLAYDEPIQPYPIQWSPDGNWLYVSIDPNETAPIIKRVAPFGTSFQIVAKGYDIQFAPRSNRWVYLNYKDQLVNDQGVVLTSSDGIVEYTWSPDAKWIIYSARQRDTYNAVKTQNLFRVSYNGGESERLTDTSVFKKFLTIEPNGENIFYYQEHGSPSRRHIWQVEFGNEQQMVIPSLWDVRDLAWSPDGQFVAAIIEYQDEVEEKLSISFIDPESFEIVSSVPVSYDIQNMLWSPDNPDYLYYTTLSRTDSRVYRLHIPTQTHEIVYQTAPNSMIQMSWSPPINKTWHPRPLVGVNLIVLFAVLWSYRVTRTHSYLG